MVESGTPVQRSDVDREIRAWLDAGADATPLCALDATTARRVMAQAFATWWGPVTTLPTVANLAVPTPEGDVPVRLYRPRDGVLPAIVYFHGGGWVIGDVDTHDGLCRQLSYDAQAVVVSVDYRRAPEHPFPAAVDDCAAAASWVLSNAAQLEIEPSRVSVAGDSAGANLAAVTSQRLLADGRRIASQALAYPVTDSDLDTGSYRRCGEGFGLTAADMRWYFDQYAPPGVDRSHPELSPLRSADLSGLPPTYIATCELDPLRDEGLAYAERLRAAAVRVVADDRMGMVHGYLCLRAITPAADELRAKIVGFLTQTWQ